MTDTAQPTLTTAVEVAKTNAKHDPKKAILHAVEVRKGDISRALPTGFTGGHERFARTVLTCVARDPKLLTCTPQSIIGAAMQAAQLGLTPGVLGEAWLIPYGNECTFQLGYKGLISLAARAGFIIRAHTVHANDHFEYELGLDPKLVHKPDMADPGEAVAWYAVATSKDGTQAGFAVLDKAKVEKRRKASRGNSPAWKDWYEEMALTKAVREVCKFLPLSVEMAVAIASDGVVRSEVDAHAEDFAADEDWIEGEVVE